MAAGVIYQTVTTTDGETVELAFYVDDTGAPTQWTPAKLLVNASGAIATANPLPIQVRSSGGTEATFNANGQATMANSTPVVIASNQDWPVSTVGFMKKEDVASADGDAGIPAMAVQKATPANTGGTDGDYEFLQMSGGHLWVAPPLTVKLSSSFATPDHAAHAANDAVADNTTAGSVTKLSWTIPKGAGRIVRVRIDKTDLTIATATFRLWLWDTTFTVAAGDNAAFSNPLTDAIGYVDVAVTNTGTDVITGWSNCDIPITATTALGLLQTLTAFDAAATETFTVDLFVLPG